MKRFLIILTAFLVLSAAVACGPGIPADPSLDPSAPASSEEASLPASPSEGQDETQPDAASSEAEPDPVSGTDEPSAQPESSAEPEPSDEPEPVSEPESSAEPEPSDVPEASSEEPSEAVSDEPSDTESSEESEEPPVPVKTWPTLSGTFIQPGSFASFTVERWERHLNNLLEAGIDIVIVQWTSETPYGKLKSLYYPSSLTFEKEASCSIQPKLLPNLLTAAEKLGVKVFVGLNLSDEWWSFACSKEDWNSMQSSLGVEMAKEIYTLYKEQYPNALYGWYFAWEMFNGMSGQEAKAASFLNQYLDPLNKLDPSMPLMLSPFIRASGGTASAAGKEWKTVFSQTHFRKGDIFCCQDAVGAGWINISQMDGYFAALKEAVDSKPGLLFWANNECFTKDYQPRPVSEFLKQMQIAQPYVSGYVTFAYSHYYSPDIPGKVANRTYHDAYIRYYETGDLNP